MALTSYISKLFVCRSERVQFNFDKWLMREVNLRSAGKDATLFEVFYNDVFTPDIHLPRTYTAFSRFVSSFLFGQGTFSFDYNRIEQVFPEHLLKAVDRSVYTPVGFRINQEADMILVLDQDDQLFALTPAVSKIYQPLKSLPSFLGFSDGVPLEYAEIELTGKDIPVVVLLSWYMGLGNLLQSVNVQYRREKRGTRFSVGEDEFSVRFEDEVLIFKRSDKRAVLLFNGFNRVKNTIKSLSIYSLDQRDGFTTILSALDIPLRQEKVWQLTFNTWVDPITRDLLVDMNEPTDLALLILSAVSKLDRDFYRDPNGMAESVIRGYQRVAGMIYTEMYRALKQYVTQPNSKNSRVELNPNAVWFSLIQDETVAPIEESNPIHAIKEKDVVVFRGKGGRSSQSMTAKHRQFSQDSIGIISEANVDNGETGTIAYLTTDPNITSLRGTVKPLENLDDPDAAKLQSISMLISPGADMDD